ncbi:hypothetical protein EV360DRAFT_78043 [Lentinula raphanica]|nr:hypothetical protein EV360DRAFT_78043 [Lentinula raphanica]
MLLFVASLRLTTLHIPLILSFFALILPPPLAMVSLRLLRNLRIHPSPIEDGFVRYSFLYFHPDSNVPLEQPFHFRLEANNTICVFEAINDIMRSEYVPSDATILSLHRLDDDDDRMPAEGRMPGDAIVLIFLSLPAALPRRSSLPRVSTPVAPTHPICATHVIALGVHFDANIRPLTSDSYYRSLQHFFQL